MSCEHNKSNYVTSNVKVAGFEFLNFVYVGSYYIYRIRFHSFIYLTFSHVVLMVGVVLFISWN